MPNNPNPNCQICSQPLSDGEFSLDRQWHFDCEKCQICNAHFPNPGRIRECLDKGQPISHTTCYHTHEIEKIRTEKIPVTKATLETMNIEILTMKHSWQPPDSDYDLLLDYLKTIQFHAQAVSWLLKLTKDKIDIKHRENNNQWDEERKTRERETRVKKETIKIQSDERSAMLAAERKDETGMLRAKRKAIETAQQMLGLSLEAATALVEKTAAPKIQ